jgi:urea transport system ATP-binding protein
MLELVGVNSFYGNTPILTDITFRIDQGDLLAILGRNGVGKTTLARTIMGLTTRMTGVMKIDDADSSAMAIHERARAGIGYVPQGRGILPKLTVRENIILGTFARRDGKREVPDSVLQLFPYLAEHLNQRAGTLSGGQLQQLAIARALATAPRLLILDEPTEGIQPNIAEQIQDTIRTLNKKMGLTVFLIEQHVEFAKSVADNFMIMDKGCIVKSAEISSLNDNLIHRYLMI